MTKASRGFSLIELMMVIATVALLAAVAAPLYQKYSLRARTAEYHLMFGAIETSLIPQLDDRAFTMTEVDDADGKRVDYKTTVNPSYPITPGRRPWEDDPSWAWLVGLPTTSLYHSYMVHEASYTPDTGYIHIHAYGDLDGNGVEHQVYRSWSRDGSYGRWFLSVTHDNLEL